MLMAKWLGGVVMTGVCKLRADEYAAHRRMSVVRKAIFFGFIAVGAAAGLFAALNGDGGLRLVMMAIGAVIGAAIGGAVTRVGKRPPSRVPSGLDQSYGQGTAAEDRDRNYWRDRGHPPFMKPPTGEPDRHMFDPDRIA
jgi:hypothetical protein